MNANWTEYKIREDYVSYTRAFRCNIHGDLPDPLRDIEQHSTVHTTVVRKGDDGQLLKHCLTVSCLDGNTRRKAVMGYLSEKGLRQKNIDWLWQHREKTGPEEWWDDGEVK